MRHHTLAVLGLMLACALWGLSFPAMRALHMEQASRMPHATTAFLSAWLQVTRFGLAALVLLPFVLGRHRPTRLELRQGVTLALWGGLGMALQADGLAHTDASVSAFLTQAYCVFLPLWASLARRRGPSWRVVAATLLVLVGGGILSGVRWDSLRIGRGEAETILAAFLFTFQILTLESPGYSGNRALPVTAVMFAAIMAQFVPVSLVLAGAPADILTAGSSPAAAALVALLAVACSVGAYLLMNRWQPLVTATEAGLIYTTEPVITSFYVLFLPAWLGKLAHIHYPNESLTPALWLGGGLIVGANLLMQWPVGGPEGSRVS